MKLLGLDCDTRKIAITIFEDGNLVSWDILESTEKEAQDRSFDLYHQFAKFIGKNKPIDRVIIEESLFQNNFWTSKTLTEVISFCKLICHQYKIPFEVVYNTTWKKNTVGKANASKADIAAFAIHKCPKLSGKKQDILDSYCIGLYGVNKYDRH